MRIHLTSKKWPAARPAGAAVAVSALAICGAGPGGVGAHRGPSRPGRRGRAQLHLPLGHRYRPGSGPQTQRIAGRPYRRVFTAAIGSTGVAYRVNGQFTHTTTMSFTAYDNLTDITRQTTSSTTVRSSRTRVGEPLRPGLPGWRAHPGTTPCGWPDIPVPAGTEERRPVSDETGGTGHGRCPVERRDAPVPPAARAQPASGPAADEGHRGVGRDPEASAMPPRWSRHIRGLQLVSFYSHIKFSGPIQKPAGARHRQQDLFHDRACRRRPLGSTATPALPRKAASSTCWPVCLRIRSRW